MGVDGNKKKPQPDSKRQSSKKESNEQKQQKGGKKEKTAWAQLKWRLRETPRVSAGGDSKRAKTEEECNGKRARRKTGRRKSEAR